MTHIVTLSPEEVRVCTLLGVERWLTKFGSQDKPNYAKGKADGKLEHELLANIRANVCEWAVAKQYNVSWNVPWYPNSLHPVRKGLADLSKNIEVRSIRTQDSIPFWDKDKENYIFGAKVLDTDYYSKVEVYGHIKASDYMVEKYYNTYINGWRVPINEFRE
jgi:hypothetical protein